MPAKFIVRDFVKGGYYHIYNSSHEGALLFKNDEDYSTFLYYLSIYLSPIERLLKKYPDLPVRYYHKNLSKEITLFNYVLLPDHFHLVVRQETDGAISRFMKQLANAYMQYITTTYHPKGSLFATRYKAARIVDHKLLPLLSRHIHIEASHLTNSTLEYQWSSYQEYTELSTRNLCHTQQILSEFPSVYAYKKFHQDTKGYIKSLERLSSILIEPLPEIEKKKKLLIKG